LDLAFVVDEREVAAGVVSPLVELLDPSPERGDWGVSRRTTDGCTLTRVVRDHVGGTNGTAC
jgi:hypothetical protein